MPSRVPTYSQFFFAPLTEDVEELLGRYQLTDSVRYADFAAVWRDMRFSTVFLGISSHAEMRRFSRVALATAVKYFLPPYSYQIRVGGLYLMHALYHAQLATPRVGVRLSLKDWTHVRKFLGESVEARHHDVAYVLLRLQAAKAVHYTAMPHLLTFQKLRNRKKEDVCSDFLGRTTAVQEVLTLSVLEEMTNVEMQYEKLKEATEGVRGEVSLTQQGFTSSLKDTVCQFFTWQQKHFSKRSKNLTRDDEDEDEEEEVDNEAQTCSRRAQLLSAIKEKSYSCFDGASKSRRHRQVEADAPQVPGLGSVQEAAAVQLRRKKPKSLKARTCKNLGEPQDTDNFQPWTMSAVESQHRGPDRETT